MNIYVDEDNHVYAGNNYIGEYDPSDPSDPVELDDIHDIPNEVIEVFDNKIILESKIVSSLTGYAFHKIYIYSKDSTNVTIDYICDMKIDSTCNYDKLYKILITEINKRHNLEHCIHESCKELSVRAVVPTNARIIDYYTEVTKILAECFNVAVSRIADFEWKPDYERKEAPFRDEVIEPLLSKMKFMGVRNIHGQDEYGRDFIFYEETLFGTRRYYGLQAKAGNLSGSAYGQINVLLNQIDNAFMIPLTDIGSDSQYYISTYIVAISGSYTRNAIKIINSKLLKGKIGSVYFIDKTDIINLIRKYWTETIQS